MEENMVVMENENNEAAEVKQESPAIGFLKKFGIGAILVFAGYGVYSAFKDITGAVKQVKDAGGLAEFKAQKEIEKAKNQEEKENKKQ